MRKDVKFGLSIAAILVVTLAVYLIVLSRSSGVPGNSGDVAKTQDSNAVAGTGNAGDSGVSGPADSQTGGAISPAAAGPAAKSTDSSASAGTIAAAPATQPSAQSNQPADWNDILSHGSGSSTALAEAQRTSTPSIDQPTIDPTSDVRTISPDVHPPTIDNIATTQPSASLATPQIAPAITPQSSTQTPQPAMIPLSASVTPTVVSPPPQSLGTSAPPTTARTHVVEAGENPSTISLAVYGSAKYYPKILAANPGVDPRRLKIGTVLVIPALGETDASPAPSSDAGSSAARIDPATQYVVQPGDSLEAISRKLYGDRSMQEKIYDENKTLIGPDEDRLKVGQVLHLPSPPTVSQ
jgi:nucleoid-associated protein YgaU